MINDGAQGPELKMLSEKKRKAGGRATQRTPCPLISHNRVSMSRLRAEFASEEDGSILVFSLFIFIAMVMVGGLAYDLMRHEQIRTHMQNVADSATLAAANLNNEFDPEFVVRDYFEASGFGDHLGGIPQNTDPSLLDPDDDGNTNDSGISVQETTNSRLVKATAGLRFGTAFMRLAGVDTLDVHVASTARQDKGDIEISMVLDVSGSMRGSRVTRMKSAAKQFVDTVLPDESIDEAERPTISLVPYNDMVNLGAVAAPYFNLEETHDYSNCARMPPSSFSSPVLNLNNEIERIGHFDRFYETTDSPITNPQCPTDDTNSIMLHSADADALKDHIDDLEADGWTAISLGAKFGAALLDGSTRNATNAMQTDGHLAERAIGLPKDYVETSGARNTKVLVLMTDGENTRQYDLKRKFKTGMSNVYYAPGYKDMFRNDVSAAYAVYVPERASSGLKPWWHPFRGRYYKKNPFIGWKGGGYHYQLTNTELFHLASIEHIGHKIYGNSVPGYSDYIYYSNGYPYSNAHEIYVYNQDLNTQTRAICDASKNAGITIYSVAFSAPSAGENLMKYCASSAAHYYEVDNDSIVLAFEAIGRNINQLKLTQ